jgi:type IV pilus assembly protein PilC
MLYHYEAYNKDKKIVRGTIESLSEEMAEGVLYRAGYERIIHLKEASAAFDWRKMLMGGPKVSQQSLLDFTTELAIMLESGLSLQIALKQLEKMSSERSFKGILAKISADLKAGTPLHKSLAGHPKIFSQTYCSMIEANEKSGTLDSGLRQIAKELKQEVETRNQIKRALIQPAIILVVAVCAVAVLLVFVFPRLTPIFASLGAEVPLTARMLIGFTNFVNSNIIAIVVVIIVLVVAGLAFYRQPSGKEYMDKLMLRLPMIGQVVLWHNTSRFSRTLSNLLRAGILLPDAMTIILRNVGNGQMRLALAEVRTRLIQGQSLSTVLENNNLFPKFLVEMVTVGETSGTLETSLGTVADYFEAKVERRVTRLTALIEPAMILILGLGVGFIAVTLISTIYGVLGSVK